MLLRRFLACEVWKTMAPFSEKKTGASDNFNLVRQASGTAWYNCEDPRNEETAEASSRVPMTVFYCANSQFVLPCFEIKRVLVRLENRWSQGSGHLLQLCQNVSFVALILDYVDWLYCSGRQCNEYHFCIVREKVAAFSIPQSTGVISVLSHCSYDRCFGFPQN